MKRINIEFSRKFLTTYEMACKELCKKTKMPQTAFDILLFLGNNPEYCTAKDIVNVRGIKANLVSMNVDKLVNEGYLNRAESTEDRRKIILSCTDKSKSIIEQGSKMQEAFFENIFEGISAEEKEQFKEIIQKIEDNMDEMMRGKKK